MAELLDVMNMLKSRVVAATQALSDAGNARTVIGGWPSRNQLDKLLQKGWTVISVYPPPGMARAGTMYPTRPFCVSPLARDLWVEEVGNNVSVKQVSGAGGGHTIAFILGSVKAENMEPLVPGENAALIVKRYEYNTVDYAAVITVSEDYNTIEGIIDGLVDKFNSLAIQDLTASKLSPIEIQIHYEVLPSAVRQIETIEFRTSGKSIWLSEVARTERTMWVNIWAPTVEKRSLFAAAINLDFGTFTDPSNPGVSNIVTMPDGTTARAFLQPDIISDDEQTQKNWRQTITLGMEYATTVEVEKTEILATQPSFTVEQPPGTSGGPGRRVRPGVFCVFDPWVIEQLEKLSIFDPSSDCG